MFVTIEQSTTASGLCFQMSKTWSKERCGSISHKWNTSTSNKEIKNLDRKWNKEGGKEFMTHLGEEGWWAMRDRGVQHRTIFFGTVAQSHDNALKCSVALFDLQVLISGTMQSQQQPGNEPRISIPDDRRIDIWIEWLAAHPLTVINIPKCDASFDHSIGVTSAFKPTPSLTSTWTYSRDWERHSRKWTGLACGVILNEDRFPLLTSRHSKIWMSSDLLNAVCLRVSWERTTKNAGWQEKFRGNWV
jgi:hypothetical protein